MPEKKPWEVPNVPWKSEAAFWSWLRGGIRCIWSKHPVKTLYMDAKRRKIPNPSPKNAKRFPEVWGVVCECCGKEVAQKDSEVDHINQSGSFKSLDDIQGFIEKMFFVDFSSIRILCKPCHSVVSHAQNKGMTFEEAKIDKEIIEIMKWKPKKRIDDFCKEHGYNDVSNDVKRKAAVSAILKGRGNV